MESFQEIVDFTKEFYEKEIQKEIYKSLISGVRYVNDMAVMGDIVEFGTMTARTAVSLSTAQKINNIKFLNRNDVRGEKKIWFFDSFEGLPEVDNLEDAGSHHVATGIWGKGTCKGLNSTQFENLIKNILNENEFFILEGWFSETTKNIPKDQKFSLIHVDCDLYVSTMSALEPLFKGGHVADGAIIFFDDYDCNYASNQTGERLAWANLIEKYQIKYTDQGSYAWAGRKFLLHSYNC